MRFGKIAITLLVTAALSASVPIILKPGWGHPINTLAGLIVQLSFPAAFIFSILGTILDRRKFFAISTVLIIIVVVLYLFVCIRLIAKYGNMLQ